MTNVVKDYDFEGLDQPTLLARYALLRDEALAKGDNVATSVLSEMVALCQVLRRRSAGPPKAPKMKAIPTLDDL